MLAQHLQMPKMYLIQCQLTCLAMGLDQISLSHPVKQLYFTAKWKRYIIYNRYTFPSYLFLCCQWRASRHYNPLPFWFGCVTFGRELGRPVFTHMDIARHRVTLHGT